MNTKDAAIIKALTELGLRNEVLLSPEQEQLLKQALDPHEQYLADLQKVFNPKGWHSNSINNLNVCGEL